MWFSQQETEISFHLNCNCFILEKMSSADEKKTMNSHNIFSAFEIVRPNAKPNLSQP